MPVSAGTSFSVWVRRGWKRRLGLTGVEALTGVEGLGVRLAGVEGLTGVGVNSLPVTARERKWR